MACDRHGRHIGLTYSYCAFMVLPLHASLEKLDDTLLEAAADLGCPRGRRSSSRFRLRPGPRRLGSVVLHSDRGEFAYFGLLGGSDAAMIGQTLWTEFFANKDWPVASAVAGAPVVLLVAPIAVYQRVQTREIEGADEAPVFHQPYRARAWA